MVCYVIFPHASWFFVIKWFSPPVFPLHLVTQHQPFTPCLYNPFFPPSLSSLYTLHSLTTSSSLIPPSPPPPPVLHRLCPSPSTPHARSPHSLHFTSLYPSIHMLSIPLSYLLWKDVVITVLFGPTLVFSYTSTIPLLSLHFLTHSTSLLFYTLDSVLLQPFISTFSIHHSPLSTPSLSTPLSHSLQLRLPACLPAPSSSYYIPRVADSVPKFPVLFSYSLVFTPIFFFFYLFDIDRGQCVQVFFFFLSAKWRQAGVQSIDADECKWLYL